MYINANMRILAVADLHGNLRALDAILAEAPPVDVVVLAGDITHFGPVRVVDTLIRRCSRLGPVVAVGGNCDGPDVALRLKELGGSVHADAREVLGATFYGAGSAQRWRSLTWEVGEDVLAGWLAQARARAESLAGGGPRVLVSHAPPYGVCDRSHAGHPGGSTAVRNAVETDHPDLVICGHIHEAAGEAACGATRVVNCGPSVEGWYSVIELGQEIRVSRARGRVGRR